MLSLQNASTPRAGWQAQWKAVEVGDFYCHVDTSEMTMPDKMHVPTWLATAQSTMDHLRDDLKNRPTVTMSSHLRNGTNSWIPLTSKQRCASFPVCIVISLSRIIQTRILSQTTSSFKILDEHGWTDEPMKFLENLWLLQYHVLIMYWSCGMSQATSRLLAPHWHPSNPGPQVLIRSIFKRCTRHCPFQAMSAVPMGTMGTTKWSHWYCRWSPYEHARFTMDNDAELAGVD